MGGRPPYGRPPRGFGGPMLRGIENLQSFLLNSRLFYLGRGRPPLRGGYGYDGDFAGRGPRVFRGRGGPMLGGPMGPMPGPMGPPLGGMYFIVCLLCCDRVI